MSKKNPKHPRHNRHHRNASAPTRARDPGRELGHDTTEWRAIKTAAGAAGAALACAFIARKDWLPPKLITGVVSVLGAVFAVGGRSDTMRAVGAGAMSAAGAQLGLMLLDERYHATRQPVTVATKPAIADRLPSDALASAFARTRARLRSSLSGAAPPGDRRNATEPPLSATDEAMQIPRTAEADVLDLVTAVSDSATADTAAAANVQDTRPTQDTQDSNHAKAPHEAEVTHADQALHNAQALHDAEALHNAPAPYGAQSLHEAQAPYDAQPQRVSAAPSTPSTPSTPDLADKPRPLDNLIASIGTAVAPGASAEARGAGAAACRAILAALETQVGQPLVAAPTVAPSQPAPLAGMLSQLAAMPREQLIEFFINRLRGAFSAGTPIQVAAGPRF